jgi:hypothetical protein
MRASEFTIEAIDPVSGRGAVTPQPPIKKSQGRAVPPVQGVTQDSVRTRYGDVARHDDPAQTAITRQDLEDMTRQIQAARKLGDDVNENFADGKKPGRKGLAKRSGVNTKASVSSLRKTAKNSTGEKARMAHWLANMKAGRAKKNK